MPAIASGRGVFSIDNASGVLTDVTNGVESATINVTKNVGGYHTLGDAWQLTIEGGKMWTASLSIINETGTGNASEILSAWAVAANGSTRTMQFDMPDSTTGSIRYSGETRMPSNNGIQTGTGGSGDPAKSTVELMGHGALTRAVIV